MAMTTGWLAHNSEGWLFKTMPQAAWRAQLIAWAEPRRYYRLRWNNRGAVLDAPTEGVSWRSVGGKTNNLWGGRGYLAGEMPGLLTINGKPARRRILVFERYLMRIVGVTWSNADGTWRVPNLRPGRNYLVLAVDDMEEYEPVAWDFVVPAVESDDGTETDTVGGG